MKIPACLKFVVFAPLWAPTALLGTQTQDFTVELQPVREPEPSDAIVLQVAMKNTSAKMDSPKS